MFIAVNLLKWIICLPVAIVFVIWVLIGYFSMLTDIGNDEFIWPSEWDW
jgi:hypothetical protein